MNESQSDQFENRIDIVLDQVMSSAQALPTETSLAGILLDAKRADERKYYLPDEDERLREVFANYLRIRSVLLESIEELQPFLAKKTSWGGDIKAFTIGYTAACMLVRSASYLIEVARSMPVIWKKLDEEEVRYGLSRNGLSQVYKSLSSPIRMWRFYEATRFYETNHHDILALKDLGQRESELIDMLEAERPFIQKKKSVFIQRSLKYRLYNFIRSHQSGYRKAMFHLFRFSGSAIAEMRQPFKNGIKGSISEKKVKRVSPAVLAKIKRKLIPGDILVTRHDDALSNLFLPGFWPHAAFFIGNAEQRESLIKQAGLLDGAQLDEFSRIPEPCSVVESKKDGVRYRELEDTLAVDSFLVLRPDLGASELLQVLHKANTHVGKRYDFLFDFTKADRLACTELVYRSFHSVAGLDFKLEEHAGRMCLSAEALIDQAMQSGRFEPVAVYGVDGDGDKICEDSECLELLRNSYKSNWT